jgi:hypothetical protein
VTGEGLAAVLASLATLATAVGNIVLQMRGQTESRQDRAAIAAKVDINTALTQDTAQKVEDVHASIVEATGTHQVLK